MESSVCQVSSLSVPRNITHSSRDPTNMLIHLSVWRPLVSIVEDAPLALCDRRSVKKEDCVACDKVHDDHVKEDLYIKYKPGQKWYYLSHQTQDEPVLFLTWDSDLDPDIALGTSWHSL